MTLLCGVGNHGIGANAMRLSPSRVIHHLVQIRALFHIASKFCDPEALQQGWSTKTVQGPALHDDFLFIFLSCILKWISDFGLQARQSSQLQGTLSLGSRCASATSMQTFLWTYASSNFNLHMASIAVVRNARKTWPPCRSSQVKCVLSAFALEGQTRFPAACRLHAPAWPCQAAAP